MLNNIKARLGSVPIISNTRAMKTFIANIVKKENEEEDIVEIPNAQYKVASLVARGDGNETSSLASNEASSSTPKIYRNEAGEHLFIIDRISESLQERPCGECRLSQQDFACDDGSKKHPRFENVDGKCHSRREAVCKESSSLHVPKMSNTETSMFANIVKKEEEEDIMEGECRPYVQYGIPPLAAKRNDNETSSPGSNNEASLNAPKRYTDEVGEHRFGLKYIVHKGPETWQERKCEECGLSQKYGHVYGSKKYAKFEVVDGRCQSRHANAGLPTKRFKGIRAAASASLSNFVSSVEKSFAKEETRSEEEKEEEEGIFEGKYPPDTQERTPSLAARSDSNEASSFASNETSSRTSKKYTNQAGEHTFGLVHIVNAAAVCWHERKCEECGLSQKFGRVYGSINYPGFEYVERKCQPIVRLRHVEQ